MDWKEYLFTIVILYGISFLIYFGLRKFVLNRFDVKKKHIFITAIVLLVIQMGLTAVIPNAVPIQFGFTILFVVAVLIFMDIIKKEREIKNRPVVGKPKPKPNKINKENDKK